MRALDVGVSRKGRKEKKNIETNICLFFFSFGKKVKHFPSL